MKLHQVLSVRMSPLPWEVPAVQMTGVCFGMWSWYPYVSILLFYTFFVAGTNREKRMLGFASVSTDTFNLVTEVGEVSSL